MQHRRAGRMAHRNVRSEMRACRTQRNATPPWRSDAAAAATRPRSVQPAARRRGPRYRLRARACMLAGGVRLSTDDMVCAVGHSATNGQRQVQWKETKKNERRSRTADAVCVLPSSLGRDRVDCPPACPTHRNSTPLSVALLSSRCRCSPGGRLGVPLVALFFPFPFPSNAPHSKGDLDS